MAKIVDIPNFRGRNSFLEAFRACADTNNSQSQTIKIQQLFSLKILDFPAQPLLYLPDHFTQKWIIKITYFYNPDN